MFGVIIIRMVFFFCLFGDVRLVMVIGFVGWVIRR